LAGCISGTIYRKKKYFLNITLDLFPVYEPWIAILCNNFSAWVQYLIAASVPFEESCFLIHIIFQTSNCYSNLSLYLDILNIPQWMSTAFRNIMHWLRDRRHRQYINYLWAEWSSFDYHQRQYSSSFHHSITFIHLHKIENLRFSLRSTAFNATSQTIAWIITLSVLSYEFNMFRPHRTIKCKKGKAILVTCRGGPYGCETSRLPHFLENRLTDGGIVVSLTRRPPFTPQEDSWYSLLLEAGSTPGP
jgi:hypothetical protein